MSAPLYIPKNLTDDKSPSAVAVTRYVKAQLEKDFSQGSTIFTDDVFFNGLMFKVKGRDVLIPEFRDFVNDIMTSLRVDSATRVGDTDRFLVLSWISLVGMKKEIPIVDLVTVYKDKVCRVDNCFNVDNVPDEVNEYSKNRSTL